MPRRPPEIIDVGKHPSIGRVDRRRETARSTKRSDDTWPQAPVTTISHRRQAGALVRSPRRQRSQNPGMSEGRRRETREGELSPCALVQLATEAIGRRDPGFRRSVRSSSFDGRTLRAQIVEPPGRAAAAADRSRASLHRRLHPRTTAAAGPDRKRASKQRALPPSSLADRPKIPRPTANQTTALKVQGRAVVTEAIEPGQAPRRRHLRGDQRERCRSSRSRSDHRLRNSSSGAGRRTTSSTARSPARSAKSAATATAPVARGAGGANPTVISRGGG
jgi:hypothetical protein